MCLILFSNLSLAEIYKDFLPYDSLATIKTKYPNAKLDPIKAAWLKDDEAFIGLSGVGILGSTNLKFSTSDNFLKMLITYNQDQIDKNPTADNSINEERIKKYNESLNLPLDDRLTLDWLRWISPDPIPLERLISKYGKPDKFDFLADTFQPYCLWDKKGVLANLSDDKKFVYSIEYYFTDEDRNITKPAPKQNNKPVVKEKNSKKSKL